MAQFRSLPRDKVLLDQFRTSDDDKDLMKKNLSLIESGDKRALHVSAEHYAWLAKDRIAARKEADEELKRLWHFACCPYDHCQTCIDDADWIESLHARLGPPSGP